MSSRAPRVIGLDVSLTSTGVAWPHRAETTRITPKCTGHQRNALLRDETTRLAAGCDLAVVEGPAYHAQSGTRHQLAGGWWAVTQALWDAGIPYAQVPPSTLKKFATGNGGPSTDKHVMLQAARQAWPHMLISNHDEADAAFLAAMGSAYLGRIRFRSPYPHALADVDWPRVGHRPAAPSQTKLNKRKKGRARARTARTRQGS